MFLSRHAYNSEVLARIVPCDSPAFKRFDEKQFIFFSVRLRIEHRSLFLHRKFKFDCCCSTLCASSRDEEGEAIAGAIYLRTRSNVASYP